MTRLKKGDRAPGGTALDFTGEPVSLESAWPQGPTFLTFLRHFG